MYFTKVKMSHEATETGMNNNDKGSIGLEGD